MNPFMLNQMYYQQREKRCARPTELQEKMLSRLRTIMWCDEVEESQVFREHRAATASAIAPLREYRMENAWVEIETIGSNGQPVWYYAPLVPSRTISPPAVRLLSDNRQMPKYAWRDIHHRFKRN